MTLSSTTSRAAYAGNGSTTEFAVPFLFIDNSHIAVTLRQAGGAELDWAETTHYSLSGAGEPGGGTLTALDAPLGGQTLVIRRVVPLTQETDYVENDPFPAEAHEQALDLAAMRDQQLQEQLDRTLRFPITDTSPLPELPSFASRANKLLGFDSSGDPTLAAAPSDLSPVTAEGTTTARGLAERFGQVITPRDFGAVGDGTADDTAALLACFKDGRPVALEGGKVYKITSDLDLRGYYGRVILGSCAAAQPGNPSGFGNSKPATIRQATSNKQILRLSGSHHVIGGFYLDYATQQTTSDTASYAIELNNFSHSLIRNIRVFYANTTIGFPQVAFAPAASNAGFDFIVDGIDSNSASECHFDFRNYNGGGTNSVFRNLYANGGGSLDFVTAGQSCNYAMRFSIWSGLHIEAPSIDGAIINTKGVEFHNCCYVMPTLRFEACTLKPNSAVWIDHIGGYCSSDISFIDMVNCRWSPTVAATMFINRVNSTLIEQRIAFIRITSSCNFGSSGTRRAHNNLGTSLSSTGCENHVRIGPIEDTGSRLTDMTWTDSTTSTGPFNVFEFNGAHTQFILRAGLSAATTRIISGSAPPSGGTWAARDICFNSSVGDVGRILCWVCTTGGTPGIWTPMRNGEGGATGQGDISTTLEPLTSRKINRWGVTLTADRAAGLGTAGVWPGCTFTILRPAGGAFNLTVGTGPIYTLATGEACEVFYDGFNWLPAGKWNL